MEEIISDNKIHTHTHTHIWKNMYMEKSWHLADYIFYLLLWSQKRQIPLTSSFLFLPLFCPLGLPLQKITF
jgi:hypothetical protein